MNLAEGLAASARRVPQAPAIISGDQTLSSYGEFAAIVARRATQLGVRWGIKPGDRVGLWASNSPQFLEFLLGIWWAGATAVPLNNMLHPREVADLLNDSHAALCLTSADRDALLVAELGGAIPTAAIDTDDVSGAERLDLSPLATSGWNDAAWIFYTSGTTGKPKGAQLSHGNLWSMSLAYLADVEAVDERSCLLHAALMSHASGLFSLPFLARGAAQVIPESRGSDASEIWQLLGQHERASVFVPPLMMRRLVADPAASAEVASRMGTLLVGAAPVLPHDLIEAVDLFGPRVWNGYGQGESPCTITAVPTSMLAAAISAGDLDLVRSVGYPRLATQVLVVGPDDHALPDGEVGEIIVRGPTVMAGYLDRPEANAETLRGGWLHTGDLGRFESGRLTLLDRSKDMVISGGANIYSREVEEVLIEFPDVIDVAVVGAPDDEWGERVVAFLVAAPGVELNVADVDQHCLDTMARYKRPKEYRVVSSLPRNGAGKIIKTDLRESLTTTDQEITQ